MGNNKTEEDFIVISVNRKKSVAKAFIDRTKLGTMEQKATVLMVPPSSSGRKKIKMKNEFGANPKWTGLGRTELAAMEAYHWIA